MAVRERPIKLAKEQPILVRRPRRSKPRADPKQLQRDFWKLFDIEKFARDWRAGIGKR